MNLKCVLENVPPNNWGFISQRYGYRSFLPSPTDLENPSLIDISQVNRKVQEILWFSVDWADPKLSRQIFSGGSS